MARGDQRALVEPADDRQVVRRHRPQAGRALGEFVLAERRQHRAGVVEQLPHPGHGGCGVAAVLVLGRADHHAVGARHQVHLAAVHPGADHALRHRHTAASPAQPQHLALHRADRQPGPQRGRVDAVGDHHGVGPRFRQVCHRRRPLHAESFAVRGQRLDDGPVVDGEFGFGDGSRAECPAPEAVRCRGRPTSSVTGWPWAASHSPTVLRSAASARSTATTKRFAGGDDVGGQAVQKAVRATAPATPDRVQQALLAGPALAVRGEHAAGHPRRAAVVGAVHADGPAVQRGAARDGQPDDAAADDGQ